jgi:aminoglycoside phosphotransferase family enzyme
MYLAVRRITREPNGGLAFDGSGELVDAIVESATFDQMAVTQGTDAQAERRLHSCEVELALNWRAGTQTGH